MIRFDDRVAIVTGAGRGLGLAYARLLAQRGAKVIVHDIGADKNGTASDPSVAIAAADRLTAEGLTAAPASGQIADRDGCLALVAAALERFGRLDILIHNAGWVGYQPITDLTPDFLDRMLATGIQTPLWLSQAAWPTMQAQRYGRILLTTSDRAIYPQYVQTGLVAYAAAKMGTIGIANVLAAEGAPHGILVNAISPVAKTRMWGIEDDPDELHPEAVAPGAAWLVSGDSTVTGWVLRASNGQFHATRAAEAEGVAYPRDLKAVPAASLEAVAQAWPAIALEAAEQRAYPPDLCTVGA